MRERTDISGTRDNMCKPDLAVHRPQCWSMQVRWGITGNAAHGEVDPTVEDL